MNDKFLKLIVNLHDGDSAGAADGGDGNGENGEATSTDNISREMRERAERIGIGDDLIDDYNKAFGNGNQNQNNAEGENNSTDTDGEENSEEEFEKLIKGKYKNVYQNRVQSLVKDRLSTKDKQISDMQKRESTGNQIFDFIAQQRNEQNEKTGRNDEIYDLTTAYKMAHFDELQKDLVKRSSSAAISAAAQSIQSGARRPTENAVKKSGTTTQRKSVEDMSDAEFDAFYEKVRRGEAHL